MPNKPLKPFKELVNKRTIAETAFQRAIWLCERSELGNRNVKWLDIELPVDERKKPRGQCIDLIGIDEASNTYVICELKFRRTSDNGNPQKAEKQILEYQKALQKNKDNLRNINHHANSRAPFDWRDIAKKAVCVVAANEKYWKYWEEDRGKQIPTCVECYSLPVPPDAFEKESNRATGTTYRPMITTKQNTWNKK